MNSPEQKTSDTPTTFKELDVEIGDIEPSVGYVSMSLDVDRFGNGTLALWASEEGRYHSSHRLVFSRRDYALLKEMIARVDAEIVRLEASGKMRAIGD